MSFEAAEDLKSFLGEEIIQGLEVTDEGVLAITWVQGEIYDVSNDKIVAIEAGGDNVTDDDTSYLVWDSSNALELQLTTAAGNQVLIATIVASSGDIDSVTEAGFDFSSVTGIDGRPRIVLSGDNEPTFAANYGRILIDQEDMPESIASFSYRNEKYRMIVNVMYDHTGPARLKNILKEIDSVFRANNKLQTRSYYYDMKPSWNTNYRDGAVRNIVDAKRDLVAL